MRWKSPSNTVKLIFAYPTIAAVFVVGCGTREMGGERSSQCIRINAQGAAVFIDNGSYLTALNRMGSTQGPPLGTSETVVICDADKGQERFTLQKPGQVFCAIFPVVGKEQLVSLSVDRQLVLQSQLELINWDANTRQKLNSATVDPDFRLRGENRFVVSPGGERFYLISQISPVQRTNMPAELQSAGTLTCWELPTGDKKFVIRDDAAPQPRLRSMVFTGDASMMAAICEPRMIVVWDAVTGNELRRFTEVDAGQLAVNENGTVLVASTRDNVRCWNLRGGAETASINVNAPVSKDRGSFLGDTAEAVGPRIVLSSDGRYLAVRHTGRSIETWDVAKGERIRREELDVKKAGAGIADVAFSPDGTLLAAVAREATGESFGWRTYDAHLYVWNVASGQLVHQSTLSRASGRGTQRLVFRRDGQRLMVVGEQDVHLCHLAVHKP